jgi:hypothetical protein
MAPQEVALRLLLDRALRSTRYLAAIAGAGAADSTQSKLTTKKGKQLLLFPLPVWFCY